MAGKPTDHVIGRFTAVHLTDQNGLGSGTNAFRPPKYVGFGSFNINFYDRRQPMVFRERIERDRLNFDRAAVWARRNSRDTTLVSAGVLRSTLKSDIAVGMPSGTTLDANRIKIISPNVRFDAFGVLRVCFECIHSSRWGYEFRRAHAYDSDVRPNVV